MGVTHHLALRSPDFPRSSLEINLELQRGDPGDSSLPNGTADNSLVKTLYLGAKTLWCVHGHREFLRCCKSGERSFSI